MEASASEEVAGYSFLLRFQEYSLTGGQTFTLLSNLQRDPDGPLVSDFILPNGDFQGGRSQRLVPDNYDPDAVDPFGDPAPKGTDLGAIPLGGFLTDVMYLGRATVTVDAGMPPGVYHLSPNSTAYSYTDSDLNSILLGDDSYTAYTVVVPEPHEYALAGGVGLLGFAACRRWLGARR